jgi:hypothetical protein
MQRGFCENLKWKMPTIMVSAALIVAPIKLI